jgi:hypothetical protein
MRNLKIPILCLAVVCSLGAAAALQQSDVSAQNGRSTSLLAPDELREWLTYLSSDDLEGRATFSEGLGLAAAYIADRLKEAGVKPAGDRGSYFQRVAVLGVRSTNRSSLTVEVNGQTRTFRDGQGITFPKNVGGKRMLTLDQVEFVGYGLNLGAAHNDYNDIDVKGKAVVWIGPRGPRSASTQRAARLLNSRASNATDEMGAEATISQAIGGGFGGDGGDTGGRGGRGGPPPDFTAVERLDSIVKPSVTASDELLEFLFSAADVKYAELRARSSEQEVLPGFTLKGVKLTFNLEADYQVVSTQYTRNVVGLVEGADPQLKNTYVVFGAHYDHVGYTTGILSGATEDRISNGADDDGSGTATLIGIARAFARGARPKRSLLFIWHAGEERGLWGSRYFADHPTIPIENVVAELNIDMIGRNRDDSQSESNTVYTVGADRISTELHNVLIDANGSLPRPLTLDFEMNDATDPERIYYRSDHYSYAAKGIPVIFFFTGLHPDYHRVTDTADKIEFAKMARIGQLVYETGRRVADRDRAVARDFKGPRTGKGASGKITVPN